MTQTPPDPSAAAYPAYPGDLPPLAPHPAAAPARPTFGSLRPKARVVQVIAAIVALISVVQLGLAWGLRGTLLAVRDEGATFNMTLANTYDALSLLFRAGLFAGFIATGLWLFEAHRRAPVLWPGKQQKRSSGWAWGAWLVPIVNFWFPLQVVRDSFHNDPRRDRMTLTGWWWGLLIAAAVASRFTAGILQSPDPDTVVNVAQFATIDTVLFVAAAVAWIKVVQAVTDEQDRVLRTP